MRLWRSARLLTLIGAALQTQYCDAIFSDEAYNLDFHHALVGIPQSHTTFFHQPTIASKGSLLYTLSESGIVAAVSPKDGALLWRQFLGERGQSYRGEGQLRTSAGSSIVASLLKSRLQVWDAADGRLIWQWQPHATISTIEVVVNTAGTWVVAGWQDKAQINHVSNFSAEDGSLLWQHDDASGDLPYRLIPGGAHLYYVSLHSVRSKGYRVKTVELELVSGTQRGRSITIHSENEVSTERSIVFVGVIGDLPLILWTDKTLKTIRIGTLLTSQTTILDTSSIKESVIDIVNVHTCSNTASDSKFLLHFRGTSTHSAIVFNVDSSTGKAGKLYDLPPMEGQGSFASACQPSDFIYIRATASEMVLMAGSSPSPLQSWPLVQEGTETGHISHIAAEVVAKGHSKYAVRSALAKASGDWQMIRNNELIWNRKEGLHGVIAAAYAKAAIDENFASKLAIEGQGNVLVAYTHRLLRHWKDLQSLRPWFGYFVQPIAQSVSPGSSSSRKTGHPRDKFGYNKLIIVATRSGRLAALDTGKSGKVVWDVQASSDTKENGWQVSRIDVNNTMVLVHCQEGPDLRVELSTGQIIERTNTERSDNIWVEDQGGRIANLSVGADGRPSQVMDSLVSDRTVVVTQDKDHSLRGWILSSQTLFIIAWAFQPPKNHVVTGVKHRPSHDPVASIGRVLGDRDVLYKFLSPNILLVTSEDRTTSHVSIDLIDAISGNIIHTVEHANVDLSIPVTAEISENVFVYGMFSRGDDLYGHHREGDSTNGYQLTVNEIFESPIPNDRGPHNLDDQSSSRWPTTEPIQGTVPSLHVASRSFLAPEPISRFTFTSTLQSISPRSLLCLTGGSNSIVAIPRYILDPRRPVGRAPTSTENEEGLFRYEASLEFDPKWVLNHKRDSLGFSDVITSPSLLESTSLVFAYGEFDLFGTRVSPIGGFDVLGKAFSKSQLVATVVALAIGTAFLAPLVRKKQVDGFWKN